MGREKIIISGANLFSGGTLSILEDCLIFANEVLSVDYEVIAIVYKKEIFPALKNIQVVEFKDVRKSYFHRLYFEYFYYKKWAKDKNVFLWLSMNDMSSNVDAKYRAVYCHNPSPFRRPVIGDLIGQPRWFFFTLFYKYLYRININKNNYVIVQQNWLRDEFAKMFDITKSKIIVSPPAFSENSYPKMINKRTDKTCHFFYPTFPRPFKNIEIICKAVHYIHENEQLDFNVTITIDGTENTYSKRLIEKYRHLPQIKFIGLISRDEVFEHYANTDCLIFPSKLETWGLPISEFKNFKKPILLADLPYAHETLSSYDKAVFFDVNDYKKLAELMILLIKNGLRFENHHEIEVAEPNSKNWRELFNILLDK